jgi:HK97 family phage prohead protease
MENQTYKSVSNTVKDVDVKNRTVLFHASVFGNIDSDADIIQPGSYLKTIQENGPAAKNRVWHLFNHWLDWPLSKPKLLKEDLIGLYCETTMPETDKANDIMKLYEAGYLTEHSVWIQIIKAVNQTAEGREIRLIQEVKLMEVSSVLWGANEAAQTIGIKSLAELNRRIENGDALLRNGTLTDEMFKRLELDLTDIKAKLALLTEPPQTIQKPEESNSATLEAINRFKNLKILNQNGREFEKGTGFNRS